MGTNVSSACNTEIVLWQTKTNTRTRRNNKILRSGYTRLLLLYVRLCFFFFFVFFRAFREEKLIFTKSLFPVNCNMYGYLKNNKKQYYGRLKIIFALRDIFFFFFTFSMCILVLRKIRFIIIQIMYTYDIIILTSRKSLSYIIHYNNSVYKTMYYKFGMASSTGINRM